MRISTGVAMVIFVAATAVGCAASTDDSAESSAAETTQNLTGICNAELIRANFGANPAIARALVWVDEEVPYSQSPSAARDGYRTDCSGLVSYAWDLPAPGLTTYAFVGGPWDNGQSYELPWDALEPGDAINFPGVLRRRTGHAILFASWANEERTIFCGIEEMRRGTVAQVTEHSLYESATRWGGPRGKNLADIFIPMRKAE